MLLQEFYFLGQLISSKNELNEKKNECQNHAQSPFSDECSVKAGGILEGRKSISSVYLFIF